MLQILFKHPEFMITVLVLLSLSIICQISMGVLCHKLIWETENMSSTGNKSLQQLKLKFSSCCKLHEGMSNISIFVDKYINQLKIYGLSLSTLKHLSGQLVLLSVLIAGIAACKGNHFHPAQASGQEPSVPDGLRDDFQDNRSGSCAGSLPWKRYQRARKLRNSSIVPEN